VFKNIVSLHLFSIIFLFHGSVYSQGNIGVIDLGVALSSSNYSREQYQMLRSDEKYKKLVEQIKGLQKELQDLQKQGETNSLTWSDAQKTAHIEKGQKKLDQFNRLRDQEENVRSNLAAKVEQTLAPKVEEIVNDIITEKNIGLLLNSQAVYFRTPAFDITQDVVTRLNAEK
jgi:Skp family chaperone for outer membrane proteins